MSGGHYDYAYGRIRDFAEAMRLDGGCDAAPVILRKAFRKHLLDVADVMRAIEWNDSGDGAEDEAGMIRSIIGKHDVAVSAKEQLLEVAGEIIRNLEQTQIQCEFVSLPLLDIVSHATGRCACESADDCHFRVQRLAETLMGPNWKDRLEEAGR